MSFTQIQSCCVPVDAVHLPILACGDLAVFKAFFDRSKDWVDLEHMADGGVLDVAAVVGVLVDFIGADDPRVARLLTLDARAQNQ